MSLQCREAARKLDRIFGWNSIDVKSGLVGGKIVGIGSVDGDGTDLSRGCLADNLAELEVVPNPDQREVDEWSEEESGDEEDLEDEDFVRFLQCGV